MLQYVNPRIGTGKRGNCLIGPSLPFGTVRLGPDIAFPQPNSGYRPGKALIGFSHTRMSGTGGAGRYGNIRVMPFVGKPRELSGPPYITFPATDRNWSRPTEEHAEVGYYRCRFPFGVEAELSATAHVGVHRYTFDSPSNAGANAEPARILVDFSALLQAGVAPAGQVPYCEDWEMEWHCVGSWVQFHSSYVMVGASTFHGGWGHFERYTVYYYIRTREAFQQVIVANESGFIDSETSILASRHRLEGNSHLRAVLTFPPPSGHLIAPSSTQQVHLEVGISFNSIDEACHFVETESRCQSIEQIRDEAQAAWMPYLSLVHVEQGGTHDEKALLGTSLLRLFTMPTEVSPSPAPTRHFTDIACLWDSIRNANSLQHLIAPEYSADLMNSLLYTAEKTGWLPDADIAGHFAYQQSGCCAEILFSEAARKGVPGVDYHRALAACVRNAETPSPDPTRFGRYLEDYETLGYLTTRVPKGCVSRHLEYTYQDWCIARLAELLGEAEIAARFDGKARRLWNLWNDEAKCFLPRHPDGSWVPGVTPAHHNWDGWNDPYSYESSLGYWSYATLHDIPGLIQRHGGPEAFDATLHDFLTRNDKTEKETRMHLPHLHACVGNPRRTAGYIRRSLATRYANSPDGMPDDEDMGCHSAYYICNAVGLYPLYGQTTYSLVPPLFERTTLRYGATGRSLIILRSGNGPHILGATVNDQELSGTLVEHEQIAQGGTLHLYT
ncbi:MAG TPA: glycoside hydrolase domain-containing protein [Candidatus Methylacidiphilales bacterium]|nr:glycoside hydrolase domain-containing protein [Candidatus Methylacidiphilales bacterium]